MFQSPCGVLVDCDAIGAIRELQLRKVSIPLRGVSRLRHFGVHRVAALSMFQSPCGVLVDCDPNSKEAFRAFTEFQSPCGVLVDCDLFTSITACGKAL